MGQWRTGSLRRKREPCLGPVGTSRRRVVRPYAQQSAKRIGEVRWFGGVTSTIYFSSGHMAKISLIISSHTSTIYLTSYYQIYLLVFLQRTPGGVLIIMTDWKLTFMSNPQTNISSSLNPATHPTLNNPFPSAWPYDWEEFVQQMSSSIHAQVHSQHTLYREDINTASLKTQ